MIDEHVNISLHLLT